LARRIQLTVNVGERLLSSKLKILRGFGARRPGLALSILTGRVATADLLPQKSRPVYRPRTVYLSEQHMQDIEAIIELLSTSQPQARRATRSAVLRRAVEHLRMAFESDPAKSLN
jgi:hypothetical protein